MAFIVRHSSVLQEMREDMKGCFLSKEERKLAIFLGQTTGDFVEQSDEEWCVWVEYSNSRTSRVNSTLEITVFVYSTSTRPWNLVVFPCWHLCRRVLGVWHIYLILRYCILPVTRRVFETTFSWGFFPQCSCCILTWAHSMAQTFYKGGWQEQVPENVLSDWRTFLTYSPSGKSQENVRTSVRLKSV